MNKVVPRKVISFTPLAYSNQSRYSNTSNPLMIRSVNICLGLSFATVSVVDFFSARLVFPLVMLA